MATNSEITEIIRQIRLTSININAHAKGHFISSGQLRQLESHFSIKLPFEPSSSTSPVNNFEEENFRRDLRKRLSDLEEEISHLTRIIKLAPTPKERVSINHQIGKLSSEKTSILKTLNG